MDNKVGGSGLNSASNEPKTPLTPGGSSLDYKNRKFGDKERKIGHRRVDDEGQVTYKKIQTTQIMGSIQLGIGHAVGSLASRPERDLLIKDFTQLETVPFTNSGSSFTPAHHYSDFRFKIYAPLAFRYFRDLFGIKPDDFLLSLCNEPLVELSNPGASGSVFYLSNDDNFIIKTVQHKEAEFLLKLLPGYYLVCFVCFVFALLSVQCFIILIIFCCFFRLWLRMDSLFACFSVCFWNAFVFWCRK